MIATYYAYTDSNGVLCVDRIGDPDGDGGVKAWSVDQVSADLAGHYPDTIYFAVDNAVPEMRVP